MFERATCIRRVVNAPAHAFYLTFDDGPDPYFTPQVLEVLDKYEAKATFFVVANKARKYSEIIHAIKSAGHALGNHSLEHNTLNYFGGPKRLEVWIRTAEQMLFDLWGTNTCGFRPPVGIQTPPLHQALYHLRMPMILWSDRFYDKLFAWTNSKALVHAQIVTAGGIILLHDEQLTKNRNTFLKSLDLYLASLEQRGMRSVAL